MQITKALHPAVSPGFVDWAPEYEPRCTRVGKRAEENGQPAVAHPRCTRVGKRERPCHETPGAPLADRQVTRLHCVPPTESEDVFAIACKKARGLCPPVGDDMVGHILAGRDDCIVKLIERGYPLNRRDDDEIAPLVTAVINGTVRTVLTLLRHGADPEVSLCRSMPMSVCIDHVLSLTDDIDTLVLLLSYGAEPKPLEINYAYSQNRILHLLVYFHWQKHCQQLGHKVVPPETMDQLKALVSQLPVSQINATVDLFEQKQWWLNHLPQTAPQGLEELWSFLKGPFD